MGRATGASSGPLAAYRKATFGPDIGDRDRPGAGAYLSVKGIRDIATGLFVIILMIADATHLVGWYTRLGYRFIEHTQWSHTNYRSVVLSKPMTVL